MALREAREEGVLDDSQVWGWVRLGRPCCSQRRHKGGREVASGRTESEAPGMTDCST